MPNYCRNPERYIDAVKNQKNVDRFWSNVEKTNGCWLWKRKLNHGYGRHWFKKKVLKAHRFSYLLEHESFDSKKVMDHICRIRNCVRPSHLREMTNRENIMIGNGFAAKLARKTHCLRGHSFSGTNLVIDHMGMRQCRTCRNFRNGQYRTKKRILAILPKKEEKI